MNSRSHWCASVVVAVVFNSTAARAEDPRPEPPRSTAGSGDEPLRSNAEVVDGAPAPGLTRGDGGEATIEARRHFQQGVTAADEGRFGDALAAFQAAYALRPAPATLFNIGNLHVALGHPVEAVATFELYLEQGGAAIPQKNRGIAVEQLAEQRRRTAEITVHVIPDGAEVQIDGRVVGTAPLAKPLRVSAGRHRVVAVLVGYRSEERALELEGLQRADVAFELQAASAPVPAPEATTPDSPPAPPGRTTGATATNAMSGEAAATRGVPGEQNGTTLRVLGYSLAGLGVAAAGSGIVIAVLGQQKHDDALAEWYAGDHARARQTEAESMDQKTLGFVVLGAGGAVTAAGALLLLAAPSRATARVRAVWLEPWVTPAGPGARVTGRW